VTIKRLDHISVVVDDLAAAIAFFTALGMTLEDEMPVEGPWVRNSSEASTACDFVRRT
jgi:catechol 2,3-dioxygenase-like lactoylglutathione lyase family enzyme